MFQGNLEFLLYAVFTFLLWMASSTILLPIVILFILKPTLRDKFFTWIFCTYIKPRFKPKILPFRKKCFDLLKEELERESFLIPLRILEIGVGSGENLEFYPENSALITVDKNPSFEVHFRKNREKYPHVHFDKIIIGMAEDMHEVKDCSVDVVVSTYVLCSVLDIEAALREVKRVLVPGGKFVFLEHVAFPSNQWSFTLQQCVAPLWALYFAGCYPDRDTAKHIKSTGFSDVICQNVDLSSLFLFVRPQIFGVASK